MVDVKNMGLYLVPLIVMAALVGCTSSPSESKSKSEKPPEDTVLLEASWATGYADLASLMADADVVVIGSVDRLLGTNTDARTAGSVTSTLIFSDYAFSVERVLKGAVSTPTITIHQTGGTSNGKTQEVIDDPIFVVDERYVLFLREFSAGNYFVIGGPSGRFIVRNDQVSSLSNIYPDRNISDLGLDKVRLEDFVSSLK